MIIKMTFDYWHMHLYYIALYCKAIEYHMSPVSLLLYKCKNTNADKLPIEDGITPA